MSVKLFSSGFFLLFERREDFRGQRMRGSCESIGNFVSARPARIAPGPAAVGALRVNLALGSYGVTLSNCDSIGQALGCGVLPATVVVSSGVYARLDLADDTGIR